MLLAALEETPRLTSLVEAVAVETLLDSVELGVLDDSVGAAAVVVAEAAMAELAATEGQDTAW